MSKRKSNKKGQMSLKEMLPAVLIFLLIGLVLGVGAILAGQFESVAEGLTSDGIANNTVNKTLTGLIVFGDFQTTIATIVAAVVIISLLLIALSVFFSRRGSQPGGGF